MGLAHSRTFRGSAAFFAMLLAAASSMGAEPIGSETGPSDQASQAMPRATAGRLVTASAASKFTRRRLPLARRLPDGAARS